MELIVTTTLLVIIGAFCLFHILTHWSRTGKLINKFPGPRVFPVIGNVLDLAVPVDILWYTFRKFADAYYSAYRLWIGTWPVVVLRHPDDLEVLFSSQKHITKSVFYDFLHPWLEEGLLTSTGKKWHRRRKILTPTFHYKMLHDFVGVFIENSERMVKALKSEGDVVVKDIEAFTATYTLNNICETAMGTSLQENVPLHDKYRCCINDMGRIVYYRSVRPWLKNNWLFSWTQKGKEQVEVLKTLHSFTRKIIKERKKYHEDTGDKFLMGISEEDETKPSLTDPTELRGVKKKRLAMLDLLIAEQKESAYMDDRGIEEEVNTFVFEGHDTTQMGICFTLLLLAEHKEIQERARAEIDSMMKSTNGKLDMRELQSLSYLDCCIKEALRMYPSVPLVSRVMKEDMQLKKFLVPRGTIIIAHIIDAHRDPSFWPEPHIYNPDRFLPENIEGRHPFSYVPFSAGPRNCIGQKFAMLELKAVVGMLLHHFYIDPVMPLSHVRLASNLIMKPLEPMIVKFTSIL